MNVAEFLQNINFVRVGGTEKELQAAEVIKDEFTKHGFTPHFEEFLTRSFTEGTAHIEVLAPYNKRYECLPVGYSGSFSEELELKPYISDVVSEIALDGKAILTKGRLNYEMHKHMAGFENTAYILVNSPFKKPTYTTNNAEGIDDFGRVRGVSMSYEDALDMLKNKAEKIRIVCDELDNESNSQNVVAELPGTELPDEIIIVCGHYDSVATSPGIIDNAAGTASVIELAKRFIANRPKRTIRFIAYGSEELGLRGSRAYVEEHQEELSNIKFVLNIDIGGDILGVNFAKVTAGEDALHYLKTWQKIHGYQIDVAHDIYSSDNMPFCQKGIPAVSFGRGGLSGYFVHWSNDKIDYVDPALITQTTNIVEKLLRDISDSPVFPFERKIAEPVKKKVTDYFKKRWNVD